MRKELLADIAIFNSGSIRADKMYDSGYLTAGDFADVDPFRNLLTKVRTTGRQVLKILEEMVAKYPSLEGRFPQISGIQFEFDASKPPGERINQESIDVLGKDFNLDEEYAVATTEYLLRGNDGCMAFTECEEILDHDSCPAMEDLLQRFFTYPSDYTYIEEYNIFFAQRQFITREKIIKAIDEKLKRTSAVLDLFGGFDIETADGNLESEEFSIYNKIPTFIRNSFEFSGKDQPKLQKKTSKDVIHVLNRHNVVKAASGEMGISIECLTR